MGSKVRKHQIEDWQEVANAQTTATDANALATAAQQDADAAQATANGKIAGHLKVVRTIVVGANEIEQDGFSHEVSTTVVEADNIVEVELYENGILNDDATVSFAADIRQGAQGQPPVTVTVFTVAGLDNLIHEGDKFTFKCAVKALPVAVPN